MRSCCGSIIKKHETAGNAHFTGSFWKSCFHVLLWWSRAVRDEKDCTLKFGRTAQLGRYTSHVCLLGRDLFVIAPSCEVKTNHPQHICAALRIDLACGYFVYLGQCTHCTTDTPTRYCDKCHAHTLSSILPLGDLRVIVSLSPSDCLARATPP